MGRKKRYDVEQVLLMMGEVFIEHGYEATSLTDLERGTGLLRGSLYRDFSSKRTMFERSLKEYLKHKPNSSKTLDLLVIGFQELQCKGIKEFCMDSGYSNAQKIWRKRFGEPEYFLENYWAEGQHHLIWKIKI